MTAYVIMIRERVTDPDEMTVYAQLARKARAVSSPQPLAFYGPLETLEGPAADGVVIFSFETMEAARAWYDSPAYQEALPHRLRGAEYRVILTEGVPPSA